MTLSRIIPTPVRAAHVAADSATHEPRAQRKALGTVAVKHDGSPKIGGAVADNLRAANPGRVGHVHPKVAHQQVGGIPSSGEAARSVLKAVGIEASDKLTTESQIQPAHDFLVKKYLDPHVEELSAEVAYAKNRTYEIRMLSDRGRPCGMVSGWHLGKTGFQIDYLTTIEFPRQGANRSRDINASLAILRQIANRHHAKALWVEVDAKMRENYQAAGFRDFARPDPTDPAGLTMMVLPLDAAMDTRLRQEPAAVWQEHIRSWYDCNWDDLKCDAAAPARAALTRMADAAIKGDLMWFQALP